MDGMQFDRFARALATSQTRRQTLRGLAGSALAGLAAQAGIVEITAGCTKPGKKGCRGPKNKKCCPGAVCKGGTKKKEGRCTCKSGLTRCGTKCVNTKSDSTHCGGCNETCAGALICTNGACTTELGCQAGDQVCLCEGACPCPGSNNAGCSCITDVEGNPRCSNLTLFICSTCTTNAECGADKACFPANIGTCDCAGNACAAATCGGSI